MRKIYLFILFMAVGQVVFAQRWASDSLFPPKVHEIIEFNGEVYIGGEFTKTYDGTAADFIMKWSDSEQEWVAVSLSDSLEPVNTLSSGVFALAVFQNELYIGGTFYGYINGSQTDNNSFLKWDGTQWSSVGRGISGNIFPRIFELTVHGDSLYFGGNTDEGRNPLGHPTYSATFDNLGLWNGSEYGSVGNFSTGGNYVNAITFYNENLYAGIGSPNASLKRWDGTTWQTISGVSRVETEMVVFQDTLFLNNNGQLYKYTESGGLEGPVRIPAGFDSNEWWIDINDFYLLNDELWMAGTYRMYDGTNTPQRVNGIDEYYVNRYDGEWSEFDISLDHGYNDEPYSVFQFNSEMFLSMDYDETLQRINPGADFELVNTYNQLGIACPGDTVRIKSISKSMTTITDYSWYVSGGTIVVDAGDQIGIVFEEGGVYDVSLVVSDGLSSDSVSSEMTNEGDFITIVDKPTYTVSDDATICQGDSAIVWVSHDAEQFFFNTTTNMDQIDFKEDSVHVFPQDTTYYSFSMRNFSDGNLVTCTFSDSVEIIVHPTYVTEVADTICEGGSYLFPDETFVENIDEETTHESLLQTIYGCDSLVITTVKVNPVYFETLNVGICETDSVFAEGEYRKVAGTYYDTLPAVTGCDSIIETILTVYPVKEQTVEDILCEGESVIIDGEEIFESGTYYDTLQTEFGCDSVVIHNVTVNALPPAYLGADTIWVCDGEEMTFDIEDKTGVESYTITTGSQEQSVDEPLVITFDASLPTVIVQSDVVGENGCVNSDVMRIVSDDIVNMYMDIPTVDQNEVSFAVGVIPENVTHWYWDFGDGDTLTGPGNPTPTHTYTENGEYTACIVAFSSCDSATDCSTINISVNSIDYYSFENLVKVYPNPAVSNIQMDIKAHYDEMQVRIMNIRSKVLNQLTFYNSESVEFTLPEAKGIYILEIVLDEQRIFRKVMKE